MIESSDLRKGLKIEIDGEPYAIVQFEFTKPGKGQALYKCRLKNMVTGAQFDKTFRSGDKFKQPDLDEHEMEYLYSDGEQYIQLRTGVSYPRNGWRCHQLPKREHGLQYLIV